MKDFPRMGISGRVIDEIISVLPLDEKVYIANLKRDEFDIMRRAFEFYVQMTIGVKFNDREYPVIMNELWKKLQKTYRLRLVK